jgi:hypothetical protein
MSRRIALAAMKLAGDETPVAHLLPETAVWRRQWREFPHHPGHPYRSSTSLLVASGHVIERPLRAVVLRLMMDAVDNEDVCLETARNVAVSLGHFDVFMELAPVAPALAKVLLDHMLLHHDASLELNVIFHFANGLASLHPRVKALIGPNSIPQARYGSRVALWLVPLTHSAGRSYYLWTAKWPSCLRVRRRAITHSRSSVAGRFSGTSLVGVCGCFFHG